MVSFTFNFRLFIFITSLFMVSTVVGTLSHESGHWLAIKLLGYDAQLHYDQTSLSVNPQSPKRSHTDSSLDNLYIMSAGPLQTMLTGTTAFVLLLFLRKRKWKGVKNKNVKWLLILFAFFWSRQVVIFIIAVFGIIAGNELSRNSDEIRIAIALGLPALSVSCITAIAGAIILLYVFLNFIASHERLSFLLSGITGSAAGYFLWMKVVGPELMP